MPDLRDPEPARKIIHPASKIRRRIYRKRKIASLVAPGPMSVYIYDTHLIHRPEMNQDSFPGNGRILKSTVIPERLLWSKSSVHSGKRTLR